MLKVMSLMKRGEGMSYEAFKKWALEEHPPLAKAIPGMRHYRMNVVLSDNPDLPYDVVSEMWFDDEDARAAGFASEAGKAAGADAAGHAANRVHLMVEEKIIIE